jgi:hypothetical protein
MVHQQESDVHSFHGIMPKRGMLSKKITGAPFHGSIITCSKEYSDCQGRLLTIFYIHVQWQTHSFVSPLIAQGEVVDGTKDSSLWCCSHRLTGLLSDGHYYCTCLPKEVLQDHI